MFEVTLSDVPLEQPKPCFFDFLLAVSYKVTVFGRPGGLQESVIESITAILTGVQRLVRVPGR